MKLLEKVCPTSKKDRLSKMKSSASSPEVRAQMIKQSADARKLEILARSNGGRVVERIARDRQLSRDVAQSNSRREIPAEHHTPGFTPDTHPLDVQVSSTRSRAHQLRSQQRNAARQERITTRDKVHKNTPRQPPSRSNTPQRRAAPSNRPVQSRSKPATRPVQTRRAPTPVVKANPPPQRIIQANAPVSTPSKSNHAQVNAIRKNSKTAARPIPVHGVRANATEDLRRRHLLESYLREHSKK
tara:strand:+ start:97090 stop:97818 length:729 start_codon:yes stop_codon:yes gene_type:complete